MLGKVSYTCCSLPAHCPGMADELFNCCILKVSIFKYPWISHCYVVTVRQNGSGVLPVTALQLPQGRWAPHVDQLTHHVSSTHSSQCGRCAPLYFSLINHLITLVLDSSLVLVLLRQILNNFTLIFGCVLLFN